MDTIELANQPNKDPFVLMNEKYGNDSIILSNQDSNLYVNELNIVPRGSIICFAGLTAPDGWLLCDGSEIEIIKYDKLFSVIGRTYGSTSINTFKLPNLSQKFPMGKSNNTDLGTICGVDSITLTSDQLPSHNHKGVVDIGGQHNHNAIDTGHTHNVQDAFFSAWNGVNAGLAGSFNGVDYDNQLFVRNTVTDTANANIIVNDASGHTHTFTTDLTGSGNSIDIMNPYIVLNYIIRY
jgi:microcystin-dependent protein